MNIQQIFKSKSKVKGVVFVLFIVLIVIILSILRKVSVIPPKNPILTVPIIPSIAPNTLQAPLDTINPHNPIQKLVFIWGSNSPNIPPVLDNYYISVPLITDSSISIIANKLGFSLAEKSPNTSQNSSLWINNNSSLFGSPKQNQIFFNSTSKLSAHVNTITKDDAISISKNILTNLFDTSLLSTMDPNPNTQFLNLNLALEDDPSETTPELANIISVNFQQLINGKPLINLSKRGETVSVVIDTNKKLSLLNVYGGYKNLIQKGKSELIDFKKLIEIAPNNAIRISYSKDVPSEAAYTEAKTINITVKNIGLGYYQRADNSIFPVFVINGIMSARGLSEYPAVYIVPATK